MSDINDGGPAFPLNCPEWHEKISASGLSGEVDFTMGMSMRDYFAAKAMQSIVSILHQGMRPVDLPHMARDAYGIADSMLKARAAK